MKYLLVLAVVFVAFWIWGHNRRVEREERDASRRRPAPGQPATPVVMVACRGCGTHLPQNEAVQGRQGAYCSHEHRQQIEGPGA